jgi:hypothetical protein
LLDLFSCPLREEDKARPHNPARDSSGYLEISKSYQIYIPSLQKVVVRKDVRFEEGMDF